VTGPRIEPTEVGSAGILRFLESRTAPHLFGLPGSSSVPIFHGLPSTHLRFVASLQEGGAMAMADGYARFAGPTGVLLYMLPGVATALSNLYNAWRDETPLVVIASQLASHARSGQVHVGEADLDEITRPFTRFVQEVSSADELMKALEAAHSAAVGPPSGPALIIVPEDVMSDRISMPAEFPVPEPHIAPLPDLQTIIHQLLSAERPVIVVGGQLRRYEGSEAVEALADHLEIPIVYEPFWNDRLGVSPGHRCMVGQLTERSSLGTQADFVLAIGCRLFNEVRPRSDQWFPADTFVAHINADSTKLVQAGRTSWSSAVPPNRIAEALLSGCRDRKLPNDLRVARQTRLATVINRRATPRPGPYSSVATALSGVLEHSYLVDESVSANLPILLELKGMQGDRYVSTTGASLGWSIGAACGVALATNEPVVCVLGDGAFFFGVQALWPAVAMQLPITFVVLDNGGFGSTKMFEERYMQEHPNTATGTAHFVGSDFSASGPSVRSVAEGFGLPVVSVASGATLETELNMNRGPGPLLLHVPIVD
jgi:thiamine pyrophosphate-dependent acetolactate synthase large subunit-like protein